MGKWEWIANSRWIIDGRVTNSYLLFQNEKDLGAHVEMISTEFEVITTIHFTHRYVVYRARIIHPKISYENRIKWNA